MKDAYLLERIDFDSMPLHQRSDLRRQGFHDPQSLLSSGRENQLDLRLSSVDFCSITNLCIGLLV